MSKVGAPPLCEKASAAIKHLNPRVAPVSYKDTTRIVHRYAMREIELTWTCRGRPRLPPSRVDADVEVLNPLAHEQERSDVALLR